MPRQAALFDFDGTMIKGDSIAQFVRFFWKNHRIPVFKLALILMMTLLWRLRLVRVEKVKSQVLSPLCALGEAQGEDLCLRFMKEILFPQIFPDAVRQITQHADSGHVILLVSASPLCYLRYLAELLPVTAVLGTDTDSRFRVEKNLIGEEKPRRIREWLQSNGMDIDWQASYAYGDSANDLPMLRMAGHPTLVNPKPEAILAESSWPRVDWR